jgi:hypothetical protein
MQLLYTFAREPTRYSYRKETGTFWAVGKQHRLAWSIGARENMAKLSLSVCFADSNGGAVIVVLCFVLVELDASILLEYHHNI